MFKNNYLYSTSPGFAIYALVLVYGNCRNLKYCPNKDVSRQIERGDEPS